MDHIWSIDFLLAAISCQPACCTHDNLNLMSFAPYPQRQRFFHQLAFCNAGSHIWQVSCQNENKRYFLDARHPKLCSADTNEMLLWLLSITLPLKEFYLDYVWVLASFRLLRSSIGFAIVFNYLLRRHAEHLKKQN